MAAAAPLAKSPLRSAVQFLRVRAVGWGFIALLAIVAYFSARLALNTQFKAPRTAGAPTQKHGPDFTAKQFSLWRTSLDGETQYKLTGDSLIHYRDDLSSVLVQPRIVAVTKRGIERTTTVSANNGLIRNEGELVQFTQNVKITRESRGSATSTLASDSFVIAPDINLIVTRSPVTVTQGKHQSTALGGIEYAHNDATLQMSGTVRTIIAPQQ